MTASGHYLSIFLFVVILAGAPELECAMSLRKKKKKGKVGGYQTYLNEIQRPSPPTDLRSGPDESIEDDEMEAEDEIELSSEEEYVFTICSIISVCKAELRW